jgi:outer membrane usher protein
VVKDDLEKATRLAFGDVFSGAGPYGSTITGAGVLFAKIYDLAPELVRHPTARLQATTALPAEVEVSVDGTSMYRGQVAPGPIAFDNLLHHGGTRTVRVVITDAAGRRQVIEQPFFFTDTVLAQGFHEYSYFAGSRSELDRDNRWRYREPAWQAVHRYGVSDSLTVSAGGEGNRDFANAGAGITLRSDLGGLLGIDLLTSQDRANRTEAHGWSARYSYLTPAGSFVLARRQFGEGFRTFATNAFNLFPRSETRVGVSSQIGRVSLGADYVRTVTDAEVRDSGFLRMATSLGNGLTLLADWQTTRAGGRKDWSANLYVRADLDQQRWTSSSVRADSQSRRVDVETGKLLPEGEGFGYRTGVATTTRPGARTDTSVYGSADWNLRQASVGLFANLPVRGDGGSYLRAEVAGALVGLDGYWGFTRQITDSFVLARLGVPQKDVEILLNNLPQGRTDEQGRLLIPQVSSLGRQEVSINDQDLAIEYTLRSRQRTVVPPYRSGMVVDFGITKLRAVAGTAWQVDAGRRSPVVARAWTMEGPGGRLSIETASSGEFYLEDAPPGRYTGTLRGSERAYACRLTVPASEEAVQELKEGIVCD